MSSLRILSHILLAFMLFAGGACARSDTFAGGRRNDPHTVVIVSNNVEHRFKVEIADDDEERRLGLMYRTEMAPNAGMLFDFEETQLISMWMKNTLIPLDMAFIAEDGEIKRIAENTTPRSLESIRSGEPVIAVLEVNGGTFARLGVKAGDIVHNPMFQAD